MAKLWLKRLLGALLTIYVVITVSFFMVRFMPGDPLQHLVGQEEYYYLMENDPAELERLAEKYGLNDPVGVQYLRYLENVIHMDFGIAYSNKQPVVENVLNCMSWTIMLSIPTWIVGGLLGGILGVIAGWKPGKLFDSIMTPIALFLNTVPSNCIAILALVVFAYNLRWVPIGGMTSGMTTGWARTADILHHMALPLSILILFRVSGDFMLMKSSVSQIRREDYTTTARAKGLPERKVLFRHVMKNALLPYVTSMCMQMGSLLSGSMMIETIFGWKGMGQLFYNAVSNRDFPTAQLCFLISAFCVVTANLVSDLIITVIDPRVMVK
ncbi:MAG: ABC transporter permease [Firmicutes bacterium]|nr:ABC transporter permease [Bacillota bacterium]MDY6159843.1 ABC transporter permease [Candidatus Faecousia sp.]